MLGQRDLWLGDLGVPALLPLDRDPALVAARREQVEHLPDRHLALAEQDQLPVTARCPAGILDLREQNTPAEVGVDLGGGLAHAARGCSWRSAWSAASAPPNTRTSGDSQSLASSRNWRSSGPGSSPVRRIELSTATTGSPAAVTVRLTCARAGAGILGSMSSPSMSRSSTPA